MIRRHAQPKAERPPCLLTVDLEDYFHVEAFSSVVWREDWPTYPSRINRNTHLVLDLLDDHSAKATFFVLGWVAERYPSLVREVHSRGHEIACHSYWHRPVYQLRPDEFREDTRRAKGVLEEIVGDPILGYRAPTFSIIRECLWALEVLVEEGFLYDASVFPIRRGAYGIPDWSRSPKWVHTRSGPILSVPASTIRRLGINLPCGGGGYLRLLPFSFNLRALRGCIAENHYGLIYVHPWELDPDQPRIPAGLISRIRHYTGLQRTAEKLERLLREFDAGPISDRMQPLLEQMAELTVGGAGRWG